MITTGYRNGWRSEDQEKASKFDRRRMWKTSRGELLRPRQFDDEHLKNTIALIDRRYDEAVDEFMMFDGMPLPPEKVEAIPVYPMLLREAKRRGLLPVPKGRMSGNETSATNAQSRRQNRRKTDRCPSCGRDI